MRQHVIFPMFLAVLFMSTSFCLAKIPEPSNLFYGNINIGAMLVTAQNTGVIVSFKVGDTIVASYRMGDNPGMGDQYLLLVPMDAEGERRDCRTAGSGVSGLRNAPACRDAYRGAGRECGIRKRWCFSS